MGFLSSSRRASYAPFAVGAAIIAVGVAFFALA
jgi:hypothetical protein